MQDVVKDVFDDPKVNAEGLNFLERLFAHQQTHEAGVILLTNVLKDERFVNEGKAWSTDLITHVIS